MRKYLVFSISFVLYFLPVVSAQTLDEARELYKAGLFAKALPIFEQEYYAKPTDPSLNQWYGVCLFETGGNLRKAEECILLASKKGIQEANLYLGRLYTKQYRFDEATKEYDKYVKLKKRDKEALARAEKETVRTAFLRKAALHTENIQIIDSIIIDKNKFLSAYKLSPSSGKINYATAETYEATSYANEKGNKIYYSKLIGADRYGLFSMEKIQNNFENEKRLSDNNFGFSGSLSFPFVLSDGVTIYFAAEDKDNLGGYDIYVTRYNLSNDTYLTPERLNSPFNSQYNDYMYIIDEEKNIGWFATDRFQTDNKVCVYTFIPNERVSMVDSDDDNYLFSRAAIFSIKDSWKEGANYSEKIALAHKSVEQEKQESKDFEFVINDKNTYYKLSDFKNPKAREMFRQLEGTKRDLKNVEDRLQKLRDSYRSGQSASKANEIIELEHSQAQLYKEVKEQEMKTRNQEIQSLKTL